VCKPDRENHWERKLFYLLTLPFLRVSACLSILRTDPFPELYEGTVQVTSLLVSFALLVVFTLSFVSDATIYRDDFMKNLPTVLALCLAVGALSGCATWPYHTSESSLADKIFLPSELDARTKHYEKKGMSYWDARRRAYSETDSKERWFYQREGEELRSKEITRDDLKRVP